MAKINFCNEQTKSTESTKDWRDAFLESNAKDIMESVEYSEANAIKVVDTLYCTKLQCLMNYCSSFTSGGMWVSSKNGVYFVTQGTDSDPDATYEGAKQFIANYEQAKQLSKKD